MRKNNILPDDIITARFKACAKIIGITSQYINHNDLEENYDLISDSENHKKALFSLLPEYIANDGLTKRAKNDLLMPEIVKSIARVHTLLDEYSDKKQNLSFDERVSILTHVTKIINQYDPILDWKEHYTLYPTTISDDQINQERAQATHLLNSWDGDQNVAPATNSNLIHKYDFSEMRTMDLICVMGVLWDDIDYELEDNSFIFKDHEVEETRLQEEFTLRPDADGSHRYDNRDTTIFNAEKRSAENNMAALNNYRLQHGPFVTDVDYGLPQTPTRFGIVGDERNDRQRLRVSGRDY
jgi:hypothetical protein